MGTNTGMVTTVLFVIEKMEEAYILNSGGLEKLFRTYLYNKYYKAPKNEAEK